MRLVNLLILIPAIGAAQGPIAEIKVTGNHRIAPPAVIAVSGLHLGDNAAHDALDAAAQRIFDTGFFSVANYRYDRKAGASGVVVTLQVEEEPLTTAVELDIPGQDQAKIWQLMLAADSLIGRRIPGNDRAGAYYKHVLEETLRRANYTQEIAFKNESDLQAGTTLILVRPAHLPKIAGIRFEGNSAIEAASLQAALAKVAMGQEYSERDFRRVLELNIRPLYEELGRLTVAFPSVRMAAQSEQEVVVTAGIEEGPVWRLGRVDLSGEGLPVADMRSAANFAEGAPANWRQLLAAVSNMEKVLRRDGYLGVHSIPQRLFRSGEPIVDVSLAVSKGRQFHFGELQLDGLDSGTEKRLAGIWSLPAGAPMNDQYINEFLRVVMPSLSGKVKSVGSEMKIRPGSDVVDVKIRFR